MERRERQENDRRAVSDGVDRVRLASPVLRDAEGYEETRRSAQSRAGDAPRRADSEVAGQEGVDQLLRVSQAPTIYLPNGMRGRLLVTPIPDQFPQLRRPGPGRPRPLRPAVASGATACLWRALPVVRGQSAPRAALGIRRRRSLSARRPLHRCRAVPADIRAEGATQPPLICGEPAGRRLRLDAPAPANRRYRQVAMGDGRGAPRRVDAGQAVRRASDRIRGGAVQPLLRRPSHRYRGQVHQEPLPGHRRAPPDARAPRPSGSSPP